MAPPSETWSPPAGAGVLPLLLIGFPPPFSAALSLGLPVGEGWLDSPVQPPELKPGPGAPTQVGVSAGRK